MENELTLEQVIDEKAAMEEKMAELLRGFMKKTDHYLWITDLSLVKKNYHGQIILDVKVEVKLP